MWTYAQYHDDGYEVSSAGDTRFSPIYARLKDGRTIEEAYQLDVKGWRKVPGMSWRLAKGRRPKNKNVDLWKEYYALWTQWANENPHLLQTLSVVAAGKVLTDRHATSIVNQARALAKLLNARHPNDTAGPTPAHRTKP